MKELKDWERAENLVKESIKIKVLAIRSLLIKGKTFAEIAQLINKNSRQSVFNFYRTHNKEI